MGKKNKMQKGIGKIGSAIGKGIIAGIAGTAAITISQMIEMKITGRKPSTAPADAVTKALDVQEVPGKKNQFTQQVHWTYGTLWGVARGLLSVAGIKRWSATAAHFAAVLGTGMIIEPALKVAPPVKKWGAKQIAIDALHHAVYAVAAGLVYDAIMRNKD